MADGWRGNALGVLSHPGFECIATPSTSFGEQLVEFGVRLVHALFHTRVQDPVSLFGGVGQQHGDDPRSTVAEVLEIGGLNYHVARHAVPLEGLHEALRWCHLAVAPLEALRPVGGMLDVSPVPAPFYLHALDDELVAASPPLSDHLRVSERLPNARAGRVEDALDANLTIGGGGYPRSCDGGLPCRAHDWAPLVCSRNLPSRSSRASNICRCFAIQAVSISSRRRPSLQWRTRPTFCVVTSPAPSRILTCFLMPVRVILKFAAKALIEASARPRRSRMARRVGSDNAAKEISSCGLY